MWWVRAKWWNRFFVILRFTMLANDGRLLMKSDVIGMREAANNVTFNSIEIGCVYGGENGC